MFFFLLLDCYIETKFNEIFSTNLRSWKIKNNVFIIKLKADIHTFLMTIYVMLYNIIWHISLIRFIADFSYHFYDLLYSISLQIPDIFHSGKDSWIMQR